MKPARLPAKLETRTAKSGGRYLWCVPFSMPSVLKAFGIVFFALLAEGT